MASKPFVKSAGTSTSVANSKSQLDKMLRRYGAAGISMSEDYQKREIVVSFVVPDTSAKNAPMVPVRIPISIMDIYRAMYGKSAVAEKRFIEQAERVAWRNLVLWVDAALSAASIGLQTITEAFFAHTVVGPGGERMVDVIEQVQSSLPAGVQRLLTSTVESE